MTRSLVITFLLLFLSFFSSAQDDTLRLDSSSIFSPNPSTSAISSVILPGLGQARNRQYYKIPIIYGAFAGVGYLIYDNKKETDKWHDLYRRKLDGEDIPEYPTARADSFKKQRDLYDKYYQLSIFGIVAVYLLQGVDAYVSAHLINFDISEDLTLSMRSGYFPSHSTLGLSLSFGLD